MTQSICARSCCDIYRGYKESPKAQIITMVVGAILLAVGVVLRMYVGHIPSLGNAISILGTGIATFGLCTMIFTRCCPQQAGSWKGEGGHHTHKPKEKIKPSTVKYPSEGDRKGHTVIKKSTSSAAPAKSTHKPPTRDTIAYGFLEFHEKMKEIGIPFDDLLMIEKTMSPSKINSKDFELVKAFRGFDDSHNEFVAFQVNKQVWVFAIENSQACRYVNGIKDEKTFYRDDELFEEIKKEIAKVFPKEKG